MRVAFVVDRFGADVNGGAEVLARQLASHLRPHVEALTVFTTTARDHSTWASHYLPGVTEESGVRIERFAPLWPRQVLLQKILAKLVMPHLTRIPAMLPQALRKMLEAGLVLAAGPLAPALVRRLEAARADYDVFVFFTYLYYPTVFGLPRVRDRAVLYPTAHDEPTLRMGIMRDLFRLPRALVFLTEEEAGLVQARFQVEHADAEVIPCGVETPSMEQSATSVPAAVRPPYLLYLGRVEANKGFPGLIHDFAQLRATAPDVVLQSSTGGRYPLRDLQLVLVGRRDIRLPSCEQVVELGFVDDAVRDALLEGCEALVLPSEHESLSLVLLEAWSRGRAVLVNGRCSATAGQVARADGGLTYDGSAGFTESAVGLLADAAARAAMGERGRRYVREQYAWNVVMTRLVRLLGRVKGDPC